MKKEKLMEIINKIDAAHKKREREMERRESVAKKKRTAPRHTRKLKS